MFRDVSPLFPGVDTEQRAGGLSSSSASSSLLGVAPTPTTGLALVRPLAPRGPVVTPRECAVPDCGMPAVSRALTGYCEVHMDGWLTTVREYTDDIGRGSFDE